MTNPHEKDARLLEKAAAGDPVACRTLVDQHLDNIYGLAFKITGNEADAEEIAQDCFLRLWKTAPKWQPKAKLGTWLYRVAYNMAVDKLRHQNRYDDNHDLETETIKEQQLKVLEDKDIKKAMNDALLKLPNRQKEAITIVHILGETNIRAAEIMDVSVEALESLLARGRRALKKILLLKQESLLGEKNDQRYG